ncbi:MAG TPA: hypothetical protein VGB13_03025 [Candidatus Krumholzibacteria bacterium]|jgi:hypothetical protein
MSQLRAHLSLALVLMCAVSALAQNDPRPAYTGSGDLRDVRPVANWFNDAVLTQGIDVEPFLQFVDDADQGLIAGARMAAWVYEKLEVGGQLAFINMDDGGDGLSDLLLYGRYQLDLGEDRPMFAIGGSVDLPTGEATLGQNTVDVRLFGALRYDVNEDLQVFGNLGFESLELPFVDDRENGLVLGGGAFLPLAESLVAIGEFNIGNNDYAAATAALDYELPPGGHLRAGVTIGLDDGAPDLLARFAFSVPIY